jgi:hypothetical protein
LGFRSERRYKREIICGTVIAKVAFCITNLPKYESKQLLKLTESKYKPNVGEIFGQYECTLILNKYSCQEKSNGRVNIRICRDIEGEMWFG